MLVLEADTWDTFKGHLSVGHSEAARETDSLLRRIALWDCFRQTGITRLRRKVR